MGRGQRPEGRQYPHGMPIDETPDEESGFGQPLPPDDRLWRHPSEVGDEIFQDTPLLTERRSSRPWPLVLVAGLVGAGAAVATIAVIGGLDPRVVERDVVERVAVTPVISALGGAAESGDIVGIADLASPSIVRLELQGDDGRSVGSGVLIRDDGHLLTNAHVAETADSIVVVRADGQEDEGVVIGTDPHTDIAVVKIEGEGHQPAVLGSALEVEVGETAIAIGSPLGLEGGPSVTVGVVSATGRSLPGEDGVTLYDMLQTDAPIAPGSSGGALLDSTGAVIGITTAIAVSDVGAEGLGFATPIDIARAVADDIIETGQARHVWLGVEGSDLEAAAARELDVDGGATVLEVMAGSPAEAAGLAPDDIIVSVQGAAIGSMSALVVALRSHDPGEEVEIGYLRGGVLDTCRPVLTHRAPEPPVAD